MSLEDLKEQGILIPEEEWGEHRLKTTVPQFTFAILFLISVSGCVMAYFGDGHTLTWIGLVVFFTAFYVMIWVNDRAVTRQRERFEKEHKEASESEEAES